ncbi:MAG TPA: hypothetical protein VHZ76_02250, partial [Gammaproteobacteria bacterium]|nr:hypothetical protein [Gammaproteobacteria bacterium]
MKYSETWLREWVNLDLPQAKICQTLTMSGLEVESITAVAQPFHHVIIGEIITVKPHPNADRLRICEVKVANQP